jgi:hypothetical protein
MEMAAVTREAGDGMSKSAAIYLPFFGKPVSSMIHPVIGPPPSTVRDSTQSDFHHERFIRPWRLSYKMQ